MPKGLGLTYLPGGENQYLETSRKFLTYVQDSKPSRSEALAWFIEPPFCLRRDRKNTEGLVRFFENIDMIREVGDRLELTVDGVGFLGTGDLEMVYRKLTTNYLVLEEILQILANAKRQFTTDEILVELKNKSVVCWKKKRQLVIRLNWLVALKKASRVGNTYRLFDANADSVVPSVPEISPHSRIQEMLIEIGRLCDFDVVKEFPIGRGVRERLDVLWRYEGDDEGRTIAFEISLEGDLLHALMRLRTAFRKMVSVPVLVIKEDDGIKAETQVARFSDLKANIKIVTTTDVEKAVKSPGDFLGLLKNIVREIRVEMREASTRRQLDFRKRRTNSLKKSKNSKKDPR